MWYFKLPLKKGAQRSSRPPEHAFSSESGGRSGAAVATAGAAGAAAVAGTAMVEVTTAVPVVLAVKQVDPKGALEATTAPIAMGWQQRR